MFRTFIQVLALGLTAASAYFLIRGVIRMSIKDIAELSKSKWGFSYQVADNLTHQRSDTIVGFTLLLVSLFVALVNLLWPMRIDDFDINYIGVVSGIVVSSIIGFIGAKISNHLQRKSFRQVIDILNEEFKDTKRKKQSEAEDK